MATWFSEKVEKRCSDIEGRGLFSIFPIGVGETVVVKGGHVFDRPTRDMLSIALGPAEIQIDDNLFIGPRTQEERELSMMCLNHSCEPNVRIVGQIVFRAIRDIRPNEELTFDYATTDDDDWEMECACKSSSCRGRITGKDWQREDIQQRYSGLFSDYLEQKINGPK